MKRILKLSILFLSLVTIFVWPRNKVDPGHSDHREVSLPPQGDNVEEPPSSAQTLAGTSQISETAKKSIGVQIREAEYWFTPRNAHDNLGKGISAPNRAQELIAHFDQIGLTLTPWSEDENWSFSLKTGTQTIPQGDRETAFYQHGPGHREWFQNSSRGIEQGMTLNDPISSQEALLTSTFRVETQLRGEPGDENQILFRDDEGKAQLSYEQLYAYDADNRLVHTELQWDNQTSQISWIIDHRDCRYPLTIDPLITRLREPLTASDGMLGSNFGNAVSISGDAMAVGAETDGDFEGAVYLFIRDEEGMWGEIKKFTSEVPSRFAFFGTSVSLRGDLLAIGESRPTVFNFSGRGSVGLYQRNHGGIGNWGKLKSLEAGDGGNGNLFGGSVALFGETLAVGASGDRGERGAIYLFRKNLGGPDAWGEAQKLRSTTDVEGDGFGASVFLADDILAGGIRVVDGKRGAVLLYQGQHGDGAANWSFHKSVGGSDGSSGDLFGISVSLFGDTLSVGASGMDSLKGAVYLFERDQGGAGNWGEVQKLVSDRNDADQYFGGSVSLVGNLLAVGARGVDSFRGMVSLFEKTATGWELLKTLTAPNGAVADSFGGAVALSGDRLAVGASRFQSDQGGVYLFERPQSRWTSIGVIAPGQVAGITNKEFSRSIAATPGSLVVGAPASSVLAQGGNEVGRAFVFTAPSGVTDQWTLQKILDPNQIENGSRFGSSVDLIPGLIAVGAPGDDNGRGQVHLFSKHQGGTNEWGEIKRIQGDANPVGERFGEAVALSDLGWLAVGAPDAPSGGKVRLYERNQGGSEQWGLKRILTYRSPFHPGSPEAARFGAALDLDGFRLLVGAPNGTGQLSNLIGGDTPLPNAGFAFIHEKDSTGVNVWAEQWRLNDGDAIGLRVGVANAQLGSTVSLSNDWAIATQAGFQSALLFHRNIPSSQLVLDTRWGRAQSFPDVVSAEIDHDILAVAKASDPRIDIFSRDPAENYQWKNRGPIKSNSFDVSASFGHELTLAGDHLFVGAPTTNNDEGTLVVFARQQLNFSEVATPVASDGESEDRYGASVALSGDTLAVGSTGNDGNPGAVYLFERGQGQVDEWGEVAKVSSSDAHRDDGFGRAISLFDTTLVVGDVTDGSRRGAVYLFDRSQSALNSWVETKKIVAGAGGAIGDEFGSSVSLHGSLLVVGAPLNGGQAYLFDRHEGGVDRWGRIKNFVPGTSTTFGQSVSLQNDTLAVGGARDVTLFQRNANGGDQWGEIVKISASDEAPGSVFGTSVSLDADTLVVGGSVLVGGGGRQGAAYLFERDQDGANQWGETAKLIDPDEFVGDGFGEVLSLSGDTLAVGSSGSVSGFGKVVIFSRNESGSNRWGRLMEFESEEMFQRFGSSIALRGNTLAVGANQDNDIGAVYLYQFSLDLFDRWIREQFGDSSVENPGLEDSTWGDLADPDKDGYANIQEAYHGMVPLVRDESPITVQESADRFNFRWERSIDHQGIQATPYWSLDLKSWYRSGEGPAGDARFIEVRNLGPAYTNEVDVMEASISSNGKESGFLRLEFTR